MKRMFKLRKPAPKKDPRPVPELEKIYSELLAQAGTCQYMVYVNQTRLNELNAEMVRVNQEAAERKALDAQAQKEGEKDAKPE